MGMERKRTHSGAFISLDIGLAGHNRTGPQALRVSGSGSIFAKNKTAARRAD
jgi:hypothetical protein